MRPSQNLVLPPRILPSFSPTKFDPPTTIILYDAVRHSQNLFPSIPKYTPFFNNYIYATIPEATPPSQNIPPLSPIISEPPRIYPSFLNYTTFSTNLYVRPSQNLPLPPRIYPAFQKHMRPSQYLRLSPRIYPTFQQLEYYATLPESTFPPKYISPFNNYMRHSQNRPSLPEYTPFSTTISSCDAPRAEYTSHNHNKWG